MPSFPGLGRRGRSSIRGPRPAHSGASALRGSPPAPGEVLRDEGTGTVALFSGTGRPFQLRRYELIDPGPGEVLIRILLANVCGSDVHMWRGGLDLKRLGLRFPVVLGHEAVGEVAAVGQGVTEDAAGNPLGPGDRLVWRYFHPCGQCGACRAGITRACRQAHRFVSGGRSAEEPPHFVGPFATHLYLPAGHVAFKVPSGLPDGPVATLNCALSAAIQGFREVGLKERDTVVVQGAGGLGLYACAVAKARGVARVIAIDSVAERLELARAFGADEVVDASRVRDPAGRVAAVKDLTGGLGADVVCEFVGQASAVAEGIRMVAPGGRYLECGCVFTGKTFAFDPAQLALMNRSVHGLTYYEPSALREAVEFLDRHRDRFPWERLMEARYPLTELDRAFEDSAARRVPRASVQID